MTLVIKGLIKNISA